MQQSFIIESRTQYHSARLRESSYDEATEDRLLNHESTSLPLSPIFRPFNPNGDVTVYLRNLPHWRQRGATYFVTFRQADSIPKKVLAEWLDIRERWYRAHNLEPAQREAEPEDFAAGYLRIPRTIRRAFEKQQAKMLHESETEASKPRFWQYESYDRIIRDAEELAAFRRYIVRNPEAAGLKASESLYFAADWLDPFDPAVA